ncbi:hypothetical protein SAMN05421821_11561 [Mucilaginibacter lappiensis]|uniref:PAS domain-containing protein n=1 Tax=Mucilaginibacter lappiensis TaxID=354630 RepID=A0ABR6PQF9_9SPHI|nr:nuclear transport factor 2 family protein [Mucilaginibacter lappiensis]MBB6111955.1 PAS domain-containing protein [Mucilaginibacter lappiensis]SIR90956.1 hypothetical protein SAMN05421821_11561 [Mucilaginibacter lappiensis]
MKDHKKLIKEIFQNIFEIPGYDEAIVKRYFSTDYVQQVDGKTLHFSEFTKHIKAVKEAIASISIIFDTIAQDNDIIFTNHRVMAITKEGRSGEVQVIAEFHIQDGQINYCNELTRQISGDPRDGDLGSRH